MVAICSFENTDSASDGERIPVTTRTETPIKKTAAGWNISKYKAKIKNKIISNKITISKDIWPYCYKIWI